MKKIFSAFFVLIFLFSASAVTAQAGAAPVETWWGKVSIDSAETNATNVHIEAFIGGSKVANVTNGLYATGYYLIDVPCDQNDQVTLKVNGISASPVQTCRPADGARQEFNLTVNLSADGASCTFNAGCSGGFCNSNVCASSAVSNATTTTTGGGGGGGGATTAAQQSVTISSVVANTPATATFTNNALDVQTVELTSSVSSSNVAVTVQQVSRPATAPSPVTSETGFAYKYLNITSTINASVLTAVKIKFTVTKSWVSSNKIDVNTIALSRLVGGAWVKLSTAKVSETSTLITFEATSPGLSVFVVTGDQVAAPPAAAVCGNGVCEAGETTASCSQDCPAVPTPAAAVCGNNVCESGENSNNCAQDCPRAPAPPIQLPKVEPTPTNIFYAVVILIIFVVGGIWHYKRKPKKHEYRYQHGGQAQQ